MQVICPWCQSPVPIDGAAPKAGECPHCGKPLVPVGSHTMRGVPIGPETISDVHRSVPPADSPSTDEPLPRSIGRYTVLSRVGSGGFGCVYRGYDEELYREVAIKVPHRHRLVTPEDIAAYREEARVLARLDHSGIVPVFDVGQNDAGAYFLVSKFVRGTDLAQRLKAGGLSVTDAARIIARTADALHHAHERGLVHRDIKPGNILLDQDGKPYVTDFGLALSQEDFASGPTFAGTPVYMSPEQARSEGHRVDRRTDVFSLGVVFYELLTGRPPFQGETVNELLEQITTREAQPPHHRNDAVPRELDRICLKALSKRASDRYQTARDMAEDLDHWLTQSETPAKPDNSKLVSDFDLRVSEFPSVRVVPKGLRPFDARDAEFFLELLPGPRDRDGLPTSIRFWKTRLESTDPAVVTPVNLIYGPSGCGKSSLVRAGLLPRLAAHVTPLYVEAAREGTERRILGGLWHLFPDLAGEVDFPVAVAALRRGQPEPGAEEGSRRLKTQLSRGRKLVIVIDQFEQFLHGAGDRLATTSLVAALRQADGVHVQVLLLMREDFWLAGQRLFQELEVPLVEGQNVELIDLFDQRHARRVLLLFGQAHGCLPERASQLTAEQRQFLDQAVAGLSEDGKVISVLLSLFAEMMKTKPWTPHSLHAVGGPRGVGLAFLNDNFPTGAGRRARPDRKAIEKPVRGILAALLPEPGSDIKGRIRGVEELQQAAGLQASEYRFDRLLDLLDRELRIITPTQAPTPQAPENPGPVPSISTSGVRDAAGRGQYYQLTHDFLVPPLREWLTLRKRESWRGRAELCLHDRASQWSRSPEDRFLPTFLEYLLIFFTVPPVRRTSEEHAVMRAASWYYGRIAAAVVLVAGLLGWWYYESDGRDRAMAVVSTIENADAADLPRQIDEKLPRVRRWADAMLRAIADKPDTDPKHRLYANLALVPIDPQRVEALKEQMLECSLEDFRLVRDRLNVSQKAVLDPIEQLALGEAFVPPLGKEVAWFFWQVLHDPRHSDQVRFRAALALAAFDPTSVLWTEDDARLVVDQLLESNRDQQRDLRKMLGIISARLLGPLVVRFRDARARPSVRAAAADALADPDYTGRHPTLLAQLVSEADSDQYDVLHAAMLRSDSKAVRDQLAAVACERLSPGATERARLELGRRRAGAVLELASLGAGEMPCDLGQDGGDPEVLTQVAARLRDRRISIQVLLDALDHASDPRLRSSVLVGLGEFALTDVPDARRQELVGKLASWYGGDPSSAIHSSCGWLLRRWGLEHEVRSVDETPLGYHKDREWFVDQVGKDFFTFIVFRPGSFTMGSPDDEPHHRKNEQAHQVRLDRVFAVCDREVTRDQFERLGGKLTAEVFGYSPESADPALGVSWPDAVEFCRGLSTRAGMSEDQQCFVPAAGGDKTVIAAFRPERPGYRLPTEAEWEFACRAGTTTPFGFGSDRELLSRYGRHVATSPLACARLRPNLRGLFDMHGNAQEWCQDWFGEQTADGALNPSGPENGRTKVLRGGGWESSAWHCRSAVRHQATPDTRDPTIGFRLVKTLPE